MVRGFLIRGPVMLAIPALFFEMLEDQGGFIMKIAGLSLIFFACAFLPACGTAPSNANSSDVANNSAGSNTSKAVQTLSLVDRPQKIVDMMAERAEQDAATPTLRIIEPKANETINSSVVSVKLDLSGDLEGYMPNMDPETKMGNHIHVILDNQPYEAYYNIGQPFELRNVADGDHILRVFPSRPWHESYKNEGAFQIVKFTVLGGGAGMIKKATPTPAQGTSKTNSSVVGATPTPEGKDMQESTASPVDLKKPLLTYSRPKGEYSGSDADAIMIDFWLANAKLTGDGGEYRVRYSVDGGEPKFIDKWAPIWLSGWVAGKHSVKLELVDKDGNLVDNGGYNSAMREITIVK